MFNKITENVEIHQTLPDTPNMTTQELKKEWDKGNKIIKEAFNSFVDKMNNVKTIKEEVLFEDSDGVSEGTITLNDDINNYDKIEIYARKSNISEALAGTFLPKLREETTHVSVNIHDHGSENFLIHIARLDVSENTVQFVYNKRVYWNGFGTLVRDDADLLKIQRVVGYKEVSYEQL